MARSFRESFKYYKARNADPDLSGVINVDNEKNETCVPRDISGNAENPFPLILKPRNKWECCEIANNPGLIFIRNPFTPLGQRYWIVRSIRDYSKAPNPVNLCPKKFKKDVIDDWWRALTSTTDGKLKNTLQTSMRWATLGYHHDWDTKVYSEAMKNEFPADLAEITNLFATTLGYLNYKAEAAIVNFYPLGTTLSGHTDHSEADLDAPLFSFSFGQQAIFLIGGHSKEEPASAICLRSGDVVVMSKASRLCYHAVPRVMKDEFEPWRLPVSNDDTTCFHPPECKRHKNETCSQINDELLKECREDVFWDPFLRYLQTTRININIRQVLKEGQKCL